MASTDDRVLEVISPRRGEPAAGARKEAERRVGEAGGGRLRGVAEAVAVVSASALAGGGAGMLAGIGLGAINPYALGLFGAVVGIVAPVLPKVAVGAWAPRWRRWSGG